jgi:hypothetical protein
MIVLALVLGLAAPLWAEDQPAVVEQAPVVEPPVVEQPQAPTEWHANLGEGEKVFHSQADADAYGRSRGVQQPPPGSPQQGVFSLQGEFLGNTQAEADAKLNADYNAQPHSIWDGTPNEDKVYYDPQTGRSVGVYATQDGRVVTKEEFFAEQERNNAKMNAVMRGVLGGADDPAVDAQTKNAISQTLAVIERTEREQAEDLQRQREEAARYVPARTLRSLESNGGDKP